MFSSLFGFSVVAGCGGWGRLTVSGGSGAGFGISNSFCLYKYLQLLNIRASTALIFGEFENKNTFVGNTRNMSVQS